MKTPEPTGASHRNLDRNVQPRFSTPIRAWHRRITGDAGLSSCVTPFRLLLANVLACAAPYRPATVRNPLLPPAWQRAK
jgi:hypothetical protein